MFHRSFWDLDLESGIWNLEFVLKVFLIYLHPQQQGTLAEWLGPGLQNRLRRFESARYLKRTSSHEGVFVFNELTATWTLNNIIMNNDGHSLYPFRQIFIPQIIINFHDKTPIFSILGLDKIKQCRTFGQERVKFLLKLCLKT
jgi:hypothetical protein